MIENVPLRRERDLSALIGDSFTLLFAHLGPLAAIAFPAFVTSLAVSLLALAVEDDVAVSAIFAASLLLQFLVFEFVRSAGVVFLEGFEKRDVLPSAEALDQAQRRIGLIGSAVFRSFFIVLVLALTIVGIPWAIKRIVKWAFISQAIMLEDRRGADVLAASAELVNGYWWSTAGRLFLTGLVIGIPSLFISGVANAALSPVFAAFIDAALVFVSVPYGIISTTLMYFDLKTRKARHDSVNPDRYAAP